MSDEKEIEVDVNEEELENFENPYILEAFSVPPVMIFPYKDDVSDLKEVAFKIPVANGEDGLVQTQNSKVLHNVPEFKELKEFADKCIKYYVREICGSNHEVEITQSWVNFLKRYHGHPVHTHANSYLSGVFYLHVDEEKGSPIEFERSDNYFPLKLGDEGFDKPDHHYNHIFPKMICSARNGHLLLFPSTLKHSVAINDLEDARVSLSFNTFPKRPFGCGEVYGEVE